MRIRRIEGRPDVRKLGRMVITVETAHVLARMAANANKAAKAGRKRHK